VGTPTTGNELCNKTYVDTKVGSVAASGSYITVAGTATAPTVALKYTPTTRMFYVSPQGSDVSGNGSALLPYASIQAAVTAAEAVSSSATPCVVSVAIGRYTENVTFSKGYVAVVGPTSNALANNAMPYVIGTITVNVGNADDLFGRVVHLEGLTITGRVVDTSAYQHTLSIKNCYITNSTTRCVFQQSSATDARTYIINCQMSGSAAFPVVECATGWLNAQFCDLTQTANQPVLAISGAGLLVQCLGCVFTATHAGSQPICVINPIAGGTHTMSNCGYIYTDATGKVDGTSNGIQLASPSVLQLTFGYFVLTGTSTGSGLAVGGSGTVIRGGSFGLFGHKITGPTSIALSTVS
jgi:hypothetical protein